LALAACLLPACGGSDGPAAGAIPAQGEFPERIVSLSPTATEILFAIGAGPQVVAVDDASSYPTNAPKTKLSGYDPNTEALATYRPDLVVYSNEPGNLRPSLDAIKVHWIMQPPAERLDDTYAQILELGVATGHRSEARKVVEEMKAEIEGIVQSLPRLSRTPTYYHELDENYFTATSNTFIGGVYALLGLKNIADTADQQGSGYPQLSGEYIIQANPDLIFLADARCCGQSAATVAARPGWDKIAAVQNGGVIELDDDIASRWGPRIVEFLRSAARALKSFESAQP
jgi:iron complex transport system substrate-binding protein